MMKTKTIRIIKERLERENGSTKTYVFDEKLAPALLCPWKFSSAFNFDKEFSLKVKKLIESREEKMYSVLVNDAIL